MDNRLESRLGQILDAKFPTVSVLHSYPVELPEVDKECGRSRPDPGIPLRDRENPIQEELPRTPRYILRSCDTSRSAP